MTKISYAVVIVLLAFSHFTISRAQDMENSDLVFFDDPLAFNESCEDLAFEDFSDTNAEPNSTLACSGPFNSLTNNNCYSPGALVPGFSLTSVPEATNSLVVITPPQFTLTNTAAGPNSTSDNTQITFDPPESGVGLFIVTPLSSGILTVEIYGPDDALLATTDLNMEQNNEGVFLGVTSEDTITRIVLNNNGQSIGELLYEIQFGDCGISLGGPDEPSTVPTLSEWGLIAMAGVLGIVGFIVIRRKRVTG